MVFFPTNYMHGVHVYMRPNYKHASMEYIWTGKFCGVGHGGCAGEKPCDAIDGCCKVRGEAM